MADQFKYQKDLEKRMHEALYGNLQLLSHLHPQSDDFIALFKKDMFVKNNKAAFFEVIHYLLNILDPEMTKKKVRNWPPYNPEREKLFRTELLQCLNEINTKYEDANIPIPMASQLISPGGRKFTEFIFKVSQLVIVEHLKKSKNGDRLLHRPKKCSNNKINKAVMRDLKKVTNVMENETAKMEEEYEKFFAKMSSKAASITSELTAMDKLLRKAKDEYTIVKATFDEKYPCNPSMRSLKEKLINLNNEYEQIQKIVQILQESQRIAIDLKSKKYCITQESQSSLPDEVFTSEGELNLVQYFKTLHFLLESNCLTLPNPTKSFLEKTKQEVNMLFEKYELLLKKCMERSNDVEDLMKRTRKLFEKTVEVDDVKPLE